MVKPPNLAFISEKRFVCIKTSTFPKAQDLGQVIPHSGCASPFIKALRVEQ